MEAARDAKQFPKMDVGDSEVVCRRTPNGKNSLAPPPRDAGRDSPLSLDYEAYESNTLGDFRDLKEFPKMDIDNSEVVCKRTPNGKNLLAPQRDAGPDSPLSLDYEAYKSNTLGDSGHLKGLQDKRGPSRSDLASPRKILADK
ncbi:uncharacterized protein LOC114588249 isoform X2 [Podarcis muralis]